MVPKKPLDNPIDTPVANLGEEDDLELAEGTLEEVEDEFDAKVGVELKGQKMIGPDGKEVDDYVDNEKGKEEILAQIKKNEALAEQAKKTQDEINRSFMPNAPHKKIGGKKKKGKKNGKGEKGEKSGKDKK